MDAPDRSGPQLPFRRPQPPPDHYRLSRLPSTISQFRRGAHHEGSSLRHRGCGGNSARNQKQQLYRN
ncbi:hypothetical protein R5R35_009608 [Gryllus longicercus]|uniref:Uncharacterized protein n=1 Tax=Gryllus longicercus TaxID=2509291 RepID=A0AAN9VQI6_9ORTH